MYYRGKESLLEKKITPLQLFFFGLGNILGPQSFIMLGTLLALTGVYGLYSLIICCCICIMVAMIYSELSLSMPIAGVVINAVNDAYGGFLSYIVGWSQVLGNMSFAAFSAMAFGIFINQPFWGSLVILIIITALQFVGVDELEFLQIGLVSIILLFFILLMVFNVGGVQNIDIQQLIQFDLSAVQKIFLGVGFFFLAFTGFEDLTTYSEEVKNLKKLPFIIFRVILVISFLFILMYFIITGSLNGSEGVDNPLIFMAQKIFGSYAGIAVSIIGCAASISTTMTTLSTVSRNIFSMAEKGFLPRSLYKINEKNIPVNAILFSFLFVLGIICLQNIELLAYLGNFIYFFIVFMVTKSLMKLRKKRSLLTRPFKVPLYPFIPYVCLFTMVGLMFFLDLKSMAMGCIWLFFGFIIYMLRIVGEYRIKVAALGGILLFCVVMIFSFIVIRGINPLFNSPVIAFTLICFVLYLLYLTITTMIEVIITRRAHLK